MGDQPVPDPANSGSGNRMVAALRNVFRSPQFIGLGVFAALVAAIQVAGVTSMLAAKVIVGIFVWAFLVFEIWASGWIKNARRYGNSILLVAACAIGCGSVYFLQVLAELRMQQTAQNESTLQQVLTRAITPLIPKQTDTARNVERTSEPNV